MKIDRRNPRHWIRLLRFAFWVLLARGLRYAWRRPAGRHVILYGHRLNGNLAALAAALQDDRSAPWQVAFLSMDRDYLLNADLGGVASVDACSWRCLGWLLRAEAVVSSHGLHAMVGLLGAPGLAFYDVWHAIPFKGFDAADFAVQHRYRETWVASPQLRQIYIDQYGFQPERVVVTGYGRTDCLVKPQRTPTELRRSYGLPAEGRLVLFAPTWVQDDPSRQLFPFGQEAKSFLAAVVDGLRPLGAELIVRTHINTRGLSGQRIAGVHWLPSDDYPDSEGLLQVCEVLICDWSSIAFDFLLLDRPVVFLDVPPPFAKGFTLGPAYRFGEVVGDMSALLAALRLSLGTPEVYRERHAESHRRVRAAIYDRFADAQSARRYVDRLQGGATRTVPG